MIAVDGSPSMVDAGPRAARGRGDRIELIVSDLSSSSSTAPVDAIFSNATFHWILDHERLFARLYAALRPGGRSRPSAGERATSPS